MFCKNCGIELPDGAKFCPECGYSNDIIVNETADLPEVTNISDKNIKDLQLSETEEAVSQNSESFNDTASLSSNDTAPVQVLNILENHILMTIDAMLGITNGALYLYINRLEFVNAQGEITCPIAELESVQKHFGTLEITTSDNKSYSFDINNKYLDIWVDSISSLIILKEDLDALQTKPLSDIDSDLSHVITTEGSDDTGATGASKKLPNIKQAGVEKAKEVIHNYKNIKKLSKGKKTIYIFVPIISIIVVALLITMISGNKNLGRSKAVAALYNKSAYNSYDIEQAVSMGLYDDLSLGSMLDYIFRNPDVSVVHEEDYYLVTISGQYRQTLGGGYYFNGKITYRVSESGSVSVSSDPSDITRIIQYLAIQLGKNSY